MTFDRAENSGTPPIESTHIAHLTSAHPRNDTRVFLKMCRGLARSGFRVDLVVADGLGDSMTDGVRISDVGKPGGRIARMIRSTWRVWLVARELNADIYQVHDPELLFVALGLRLSGKCVVFDSHEDVPKQLLSKPYLNPITARILSVLFGVLERFICARLNGVIAATPAILGKFRGINPHSVAINNFPLRDELASTTAGPRSAEIAYVGGISEIRGIRTVIESFALIKSDARLNLVGLFSERPLESEVKSLAGWVRVNELGFQDRSGVSQILSRSIAGLVTFLPLPNHIDAQPNKMFEYMSAGIPVIASHFPLWREIIEGNDCGLCVDPASASEIAGAIDRLVGTPGLAERLGRNGREAVLKKYNWDVEEQALIDYYYRIKEAV